MDAFTGIEVGVSHRIIYQTRTTVFNHIPNTEKRVENTAHTEVFCDELRGGIVVKHCLECLIFFSIQTKTQEKTKK